MHNSDNATLDVPSGYPGKPRSFSNRSGRPILALAATAAVLLGACSSDNTTSTDGSEPPATELGSTDSPTSAPSTSEAVIETDPTTTTSEPVPATEETTSTEAQLPTTTEAPAPTAAPEADLTAQLEAAMDAHTQAWVTCVSQAPACDVSALVDTRAGDQLESSVNIITGANTNGWTVSNLESYRTEIESVEFMDGDARALVTTCNEDGLVTSKDGEIVNDRFSSRRTVWTFELFDDVWKATTGIELESAVGQENSLCSF